MLLTYANIFHDAPAQVHSGDEVEENFQSVKTVLNGNVDTDNLADAAVTTAKIEASAITAALILDGAVGSDEIAAGAVIAAKIGAGAVTSTGLGAQAVTEAKMEYTVASSGVEVLRTGPSATNYGTEGLLVCRCQTAVASGMEDLEAITVTFAGTGDTTTLDGNPAFSAAPHLVGMEYFVNSTTITDAPISMWASAVTATTATVQLNFAASPSSAVAGVLYTTWIGKVTA